MTSELSIGRRTWITLATALALLAAGPLPAAAEDFDDALARIDRALRTNPKRVPAEALLSCQNRRNYAAQLAHAGEWQRARRGLRYCFRLLKIPEEPRVAQDQEVLADAEPRQLGELLQLLTVF